jgi:hypothetical protein
MRKSVFRWSLFIGSVGVGWLLPLGRGQADRTCDQWVQSLTTIAIGAPFFQNALAQCMSLTRTTRAAVLNCAWLKVAAKWPELAVNRCVRDRLLNHEIVSTHWNNVPKEAMKLDWCGAPKPAKSVMPHRDDRPTTRPLFEDGWVALFSAQADTRAIEKRRVP